MLGRDKAKYSLKESELHRLHNIATHQIMGKTLNKKTSGSEKSLFRPMFMPIFYVKIVGSLSIKGGHHRT